MTDAENNGDMSLHEAALTGNTDKARELNDGESPLSVAADWGHAEAVQVLAELAAAQRNRPRNGVRILVLAIRSKFSVRR